jgi:hypothetical protein
MIAAAPAQAPGQDTVGPSGRVPAVASARLRSRLAAGGAARIVHRGRDAVYLDVDGWCVGVLSARAVAVPCGLRTSLPDLGGLADAARARVFDGAVELDDVRVQVGRLESATVPRLGPVEAPLVEQVLAGGVPATRELPGLLDRPLPTLLGRGSGLTPLADDVLCGWLATHHALGGEVPALPDPRARTTLLSATLVDCARHGEAIPEFRALLRALGTGDRAGVARAVAAVGAVGHTSGAGLLLGAGLRLQEGPGQR